MNGRLALISTLAACVLATPAALAAPPGSNIRPPPRRGVVRGPLRLVQRAARRRNE